MTRQLRPRALLTIFSLVLTDAALATGGASEFSILNEKEAEAYCLNHFDGSIENEGEWLIQKFELHVSPDSQKISAKESALRPISIVSLEGIAGSSLSLELEDSEQWYCIDIQKLSKTKLTINLGCDSKVLSFNHRKNASVVSILGGLDCQEDQDPGNSAVLAQSK